ncbi:hypothetical protein AYK61_13350 [Rhodococcus sp. SBT000017]|nr:hypothetical protein AYK61_13350 [Rhodococcus sp. SBT000017]
MLAIDAFFEILNSSTPLHQIVQGPTVTTGLTWPVGVHRTNGGVALSCRIIIMCAMSEAGR